MVKSKEAVDEKIRLVLRQVATALSKDARDTAHRLGVQPTHLLVLEAIERGHAQTLTEIAALVGISKPSLSDSIAVMVEKKWLQSTPQEADQRRQVLCLTKKGTALLASAQGSSTFGIDKLQPAERHVFLRGLCEVVSCLQREQKVTVSRMCVSCSYFRPDKHSHAKTPHHCAFIDKPLGNKDLQIDCPDHVALE